MSLGRKFVVEITMSIHTSEGLTVILEVKFGVPQNGEKLEAMEIICSILRDISQELNESHSNFFSIVQIIKYSKVYVHLL